MRSQFSTAVDCAANFYRGWAKINLAQLPIFPTVALHGGYG
jgi:hypothetical protein